VTAKFWNVGVETSVGKQRGYFRTQSSRGNISFVDRISQNIPHLFFHAPTIPPGAALQSILNAVLHIPNNKLRHGVLPMMKLIS